MYFLNTHLVGNAKRILVLPGKMKRMRYFARWQFLTTVDCKKNSTHTLCDSAFICTVNYPLSILILKSKSWEVEKTTNKEPTVARTLPWKESIEVITNTSFVSAQSRALTAFINHMFDTAFKQWFEQTTKKYFYALHLEIIWESKPVRKSQQLKQHRQVNLQKSKVRLAINCSR